MFHLFEAIKLIVRRYLNIKRVQAEVDIDVHLKRRISSAIIGSDAIQHHWKTVAGAIPKKFEQYSVCLLQAITELWINVRGHSFAQGWTMMFESIRKEQGKLYSHKNRSRLGFYCMI